MFYSWATKYFLFVVFPCHRKLWLCFVFLITWYKGDRDLLILGQMPDDILVSHLQFAFFQMGILFINRSNLWSLLFNVPASCWISSHTHVSLHSTHCMFAYITHPPERQSAQSCFIHWIYHRIYGFCLNTVRVLSNKNTRPWNESYSLERSADMTQLVWVFSQLFFNVFLSH